MDANKAAIRIGGISSGIVGEGFAVFIGVVQGKIHNNSHGMFAFAFFS